MKNKCSLQKSQKSKNQTLAGHLDSLQTLVRKLETSNTKEQAGWIKYRTWSYKKKKKKKKKKVIRRQDRSLSQHKRRKELLF